MLTHKEFDQIIDTIGHEASASLLFLGRRIPPLCPSRKDFQSCRTSLMQCDATIRSDRVFAQTGARRSGAIEHNENLASLWGDLHAEAWAATIPIDNVFWGYWERINRPLSELRSRHGSPQIRRYLRSK
jgi:hypothetical protein